VHLGSVTPIAIDLEFIALPGERYDSICEVSHNLVTGETTRQWDEELGPVPPYDTGPDTLILTFAAQAEMGCYLASKRRFPVNVIDLRVEYRRRANGDPRARGKGSLLDAAAFYGIDCISPIVKDAERKRIMAGRPFTKAEQTRGLDYCETDVMELAALWRAMVADGAIDLPRALYRARAILTTAEQEFLGIPMDHATVRRLLEPEVLEQIRRQAIPRLDNWGLYDGSVFKHDRFAALLKAQGRSWPLVEDDPQHRRQHAELLDVNAWEEETRPASPKSGQIDLKRKTFRSMIKIYPDLAPVYEVRHHLSQMRQLKLKVGHDARCRTPWWGFSSKTARFQPKATEQPFGNSTWVRSTIRPGPGMAIAYVDYSGAEFGIAAARSNCARMIDVYVNGDPPDPYLGSAKLFGMVPEDADKVSHFDMREMFKVALLAIQYGMLAKSLAERLNISWDMAHEMIGQHHWNYPEYWDWIKRWLRQAFTTGYVCTEGGWTMSLEKPISERTARNWPIQSSGSELFRLALIMMSRLKIRVVAPVHDAVLIEARIEDIEAEVARARHCMERASRCVLKRLTLRTDYQIVRYPDRYIDKRGKATWEAVEAILKDIDDPFARGVAPTVRRDC
jgi:DNA polymerase-1